MSAAQVMTHLKNLTTHEWVVSIFFALLLLTATAIASRVITRLIQSYLNKDDTPLPSSSIIVNIARVLIWGLGICIVLDSCFGINATALIAAMGVGGIALSLGFQDTIANLIGGLQVTFMRLVTPGDYIEVAGSTGVVKDVTWRHTRIDNKSGEVVIIPNAVISKTALVHVLNPGTVKVPFNLSQKVENLDEAAERIKEAARQAIEGLAELDGEIKVQFTSMTELAIMGNVVFSLQDTTQKALVIDAVVRAIAHEAHELVK